MYWRIKKGENKEVLVNLQQMQPNTPEAKKKGEREVLTGIKQIP